ncbi:hypothetical protein P7C70_g5573, partial [Phenoliferia sp. Uapishka_3]
MEPTAASVSPEVELYSPGEWKDTKGSGVPYASMLGSWHVVASTLPLWKGKKNVVISYTPISGEPEHTFDDVVSYNKVSDAVGKTPSTVKGIDRLEAGTAGAWKWRGKGLLAIATSRWQLLGFTVHSNPGAQSEPEWVVTYFASTLFTPAGLDIYARTPRGLPDEHVDKLTKAIEALGGEVSQLVKDGGMFRISHD